ncbi:MULTISPECIES: enolase C-terminal domain-like protein [Bacteria]|uniref:enolase C-terminal domain-like protein n=1 Tax=Bacteria TaxID=2 RepID=UPI003C7D2F8D
MKITHVECFLVDQPAPEIPFRWRTGLPGSPPDRVSAVVRVVASDGSEGVAFSRNGVITRDLIDRRIRDDLVGVDPMNREYAWHRMWELDRVEEFPIYTLGVIDNALWDLAAKRAGLSLWQYLGGYRTRLPAYASTSTFGSVSEYLDVIDQSLALGYRAVKLHAWGDARRDAELSLAVREHVGPEVPLMFDGSAGFGLADAIYVGRALEEAGYLWYEEPMREFSIHSYQRLGESVRVPLLVGETSDGAHMNIADFIVAGCATAVRTSTELKGGITGAMRVAHLADSFQVNAEIHGPGIPHEHLAMAIPNTTWYESLVTTSMVERERIVGADGDIQAPSQVGIGLPEGLDYPSALGQHVRMSEPVPG